MRPVSGFGANNARLSFELMSPPARELDQAPDRVAASVHSGGLRLYQVPVLRDDWRWALNGCVKEGRVTKSVMGTPHNFPLYYVIVYACFWFGHLQILII